VTLGVYTIGVTQIKFWLEYVLCEFLIKVRLLYTKSEFNFKICLALLQRNTHNINDVPYLTLQLVLNTAFNIVHTDGTNRERNLFAIML